MDSVDILRFVAALGVVLGLIALAAFAARRFGVGGVPQGRGGKVRRLAVTEALALDAKRRLVLVRADGREHLLLLGPAGDLVVSRRLEAAGHGPLEGAPGRLEPKLP